MDKFAFLQPWQNAIRECKLLHDSIAVEDSREFRASQLPVHASIRCWPSLPKGYEQLAGRCSILVPFPADVSLRRDRKKLQRIREALELFNALATMNRRAFLHLLVEFVVVADHFDDIFTPDLIFVSPVWECYLVGRLNSEEVVRTWGELFGCGEDPMEYSEEFGVAMGKLEIMKEETMKVLQDFIGQQTAVEWCDPTVVIEWTAEHVAVPTRGVQVISTSKAVSPRLDGIFKTNVPEVVRLCSVSDPTRMMKLWEGLSANATAQAVETMKPRFSERGMLELTAALSRMNLTKLRLNLDDEVGSMVSSDACANAGVFMSSLVCGSWTRVGAWKEPCVSLHRRGNIKHLEIVFARNSAAGPAGICSALANASSIEHLTINMGTIGDRFEWLNQVRWGWVAYALWSSVSKTSAQSVELTNIHLTASTIATIALTQTNCYPPSTVNHNALETSNFGFIDIQQDAKLRPSTLDESENSSVVMCDSFRCRARYNPEEMGDRAEVIVPGHGVCTLHLADDASTYIPDNVTPCRKADQAQNVHTLTLKFFQVEHPTLVTNLLSVIGSNLRSLTMGIYWTGRRCRISLDRVAAGCPRLEELYLTDFDVEVSSSQELKNWGLKKLFIQSCEEVAGLTECLSDPANRMSLELEELEIRIPRSNHITDYYLDALTTCNGEYIAVVEKELPLECKSAVVSVVECGDCESLNSRNSNPIHQLNETLMGIIFSFAATPMRRTVRIISL